MKTAETVLIVSALAAAVALVLIPRRAAASPSRNVAAPAVGGQAGDLWTDQRQAAYREQLASEMTGPGWEFM